MFKTFHRASSFPSFESVFVAWKKGRKERKGRRGGEKDTCPSDVVFREPNVSAPKKAFSSMNFLSDSESRLKQYHEDRACLANNLLAFLSFYFLTYEQRRIVPIEQDFTFVLDWSLVRNRGTIDGENAFRVPGKRSKTTYFCFQGITFESIEKRVSF